jgi:O-antigen/teichoic acid export membrane protein
MFDLSSRVNNLIRKWVSKNERSSHLIQSGIRSIGVKITSTILGLIIAALLARILGPEGYGVYAFTLTIIGLLAMPVKAGTPQIVVRETAKLTAHKEWSLVRGVWNWSMRVVIGGYLVVLVLFLIFWLRYIESISIERRESLFIGVSVLLPFLSLTALRGGQIQGLRKVILGQIPEYVIRPGLFLISIVIVIGCYQKVGLSAQSAVALNAFGTVLAFCIATYFLWRVRPDGLQKGENCTYRSKDWLRAAVPLTLVGGFQVINNQADILMIGTLLGDSEVGVYKVAVQLASLVVFGLAAVNLVIRPYVSKLYSQGRMRDLQILVTSSARAIFFVAIMPIVLFLVLAPTLLEFTFGKAYVSASFSLQVLTIGQMSNAFFASVGVLLNMTGHERDTMKIVAIAAALNVGLNFLLTRFFGGSFGVVYI